MRIPGPISVFATVWTALLVVFAPGCTIVRHEALEPSIQVSERPPTQKDTLQTVNAALLTEIDSLRSLAAGQAQKLADLGGRNTQLSNRIALLNDRIKALEDHIQSLATPPPAHQPRGAAIRSSRKAQPPQNRAREVYQVALQDFEARRYENALKGFSEVLTLAPKLLMASNAQYWIGECHYGRKSYSQAIQEFQKVFTYPKTEKDDDAQLKIGLCFREMGEPGKATVELKRLTADYPESEYVERAQSILRELQSHKEKAGH